MRVNSIHVVDTIAEVARQHRITQIVLGESPRQSMWSFLFKKPITYQLLERLNSIDIHIIATGSRF